MEEITSSNVNANDESEIDPQLRWRSTTNNIVKFQVTPQGTTATVDGEPASLPYAIAVNTQKNSLYQTARTHRLLTSRASDGNWTVHFLGAEFFLKQASDQIPEHVKPIIPHTIIALAVCSADATGTGACAAQAGAGTATGAGACAAQAGAGTATGAGACGAQAGAGSACGAQACGADTCAAAACPANACGANACAADLGLIPCPAEACVAHLGIPFCPFIL